MGFGLDDEPLITGGKCGYKGEPVAAVVADSERLANDAIAKIRVSWEVLPHVLDVEEAIKPSAVVVNDTYPGNTFTYHDKYDHQKLRFGDVEAAFRMADRVIEGRYQMSPIEQAPTETCGAIAAQEGANRYVCYTSTQALFFSLGTAAKLLNIASNRMHFIGGTVGGGFGGKVDSLHEPMAILGCMLTGRPVKYQFDREEEMQVGAPRGAERWYLKDAVGRDGRILGRQLTGYFDAGAYTRLSSYAIHKSTGHLPGPYTIPNVKSDVYCVFTNRTPSTAMRGFGITGVDFAIESHMDVVAHEIGMNPIEFRILNAYRDGDMKAHRRVAKNTALIECCQVVAEKTNWPIRDEFKRMSSSAGGGQGEAGRVPNYTATDQNGLIDARNRGIKRRPGDPERPFSFPGTPAPRPEPLRPSTPTPAYAGGGPLPGFAPTPGSSGRYEPRPSPSVAPNYAPPTYIPPPSTGPQPLQPAASNSPSQPAPAQAGSPAPNRGPNRFSSSISGLRRR
jgi:CO/xanthine dehydrogenase Mo-binding subunit